MDGVGSADDLMPQIHGLRRLTDAEVHADLREQAASLGERTTHIVGRLDALGVEGLAALSDEDVQAIQEEIDRIGGALCIKFLAVMAGAPA